MTRRWLAAAALAVLCGCKAEGLSSDWKRLDPPAPAPDFTLKQLDGSDVSLSGLQGRVVVMEFWATWCGPCRISTPSLDAIFREFRNRPVSVLLINEDDGAPDPVREWAGKRFVAPILLDEGMEVSKVYGVAGIPTLFILDRQGRIVYRKSGYRGGLERNLRLILNELLAEEPPKDA